MSIPSALAPDFKPSGFDRFNTLENAAPWEESEGEALACGVSPFCHNTTSEASAAHLEEEEEVLETLGGTAITVPPSSALTSSPDPRHESVSTASDPQLNAMPAALRTSRNTSLPQHLPAVGNSNQEEEETGMALFSPVFCFDSRSKEVIDTRSTPQGTPASSTVSGAQRQHPSFPKVSWGSEGAGMSKNVFGPAEGSHGSVGGYGPRKTNKYASPTAISPSTPNTVSAMDLMMLASTSTSSKLVGVGGGWHYPYKSSHKYPSSATSAWPSHGTQSGASTCSPTSGLPEPPTHTTTPPSSNIVAPSASVGTAIAASFTRLAANAFQTTTNSLESSQQTDSERRNGLMANPEPVDPSRFPHSSVQESNHYGKPQETSNESISFSPPFIASYAALPTAIEEERLKQSHGETVNPPSTSLISASSQNIPTTEKPLDGHASRVRYQANSNLPAVITSAAIMKEGTTHGRATFANDFISSSGQEAFPSSTSSASRQTAVEVKPFSTSDKNSACWVRGSTLAQQGASSAPQYGSSLIHPAVSSSAANSMGNHTSISQAASPISHRLNEIIDQLPSSQQSAALVFLEGLLSDRAKTTPPGIPSNSSLNNEADTVAPSPSSPPTAHSTLHPYNSSTNSSTLYVSRQKNAPHESNITVKNPSVLFHVSGGSGPRMDHSAMPATDDAGFNPSLPSEIENGLQFNFESRSTKAPANSLPPYLIPFGDPHSEPLDSFPAAPMSTPVDFHPHIFPSSAPATSNLSSGIPFHTAGVESLVNDALSQSVLRNMAYPEKENDSSPHVYLSSNFTEPSMKIESSTQSATGMGLQTSLPSTMAQSGSVSTVVGNVRGPLSLEKAPPQNPKTLASSSAAVNQKVNARTNRGLGFPAAPSHYHYDDAEGKSSGTTESSISVSISGQGVQGAVKNGKRRAAQINDASGAPGGTNHRQAPRCSPERVASNQTDTSSGTSTSVELHPHLKRSKSFSHFPRSWKRQGKEGEAGFTSSTRDGKYSAPPVVSMLCSEALNKTKRMTHFYPLPKREPRRNQVARSKFMTTPNTPLRNSPPSIPFPASPLETLDGHNQHHPRSPHETSSTNRSPLLNSLQASASASGLCTGGGSQPPLHRQSSSFMTGRSGVVDTSSDEVEESHGSVLPTPVSNRPVPGSSGYWSLGASPPSTVGDVKRVKSSSNLSMRGRSYRNSAGDPFSTPTGRQPPPYNFRRHSITSHTPSHSSTAKVNGVERRAYWRGGRGKPMRPSHPATGDSPTKEKRKLESLDSLSDESSGMLDSNSSSARSVGLARHDNAVGVLREANSRSSFALQAPEPSNVTQTSGGELRVAPAGLGNDDDLIENQKAIIAAEKSDLRFIMAHHETFFHLSEEQLDNLLNAFQRHVLYKDELLTQEGGPALNSLFLLLTGRVSLESKERPTSRAMNRRIFYGELEMSYELEHSSVTMRVLSESAIFFLLSREDYHRFVLVERRAREQDIAHFVNNLPLFQSLSPSSRQLLAKAFTVTRIEKGTVLFSEGKFADTMFLIIQGSLLMHTACSLEKVEKEVGGELVISHSLRNPARPTQEPSEACLSPVEDSENEAGKAPVSRTQDEATVSECASALQEWFASHAFNISEQGTKEGRVELGVEKGPGELVNAPEFLFKTSSMFETIAPCSLLVGKVTWLQFEPTMAHSHLHAIQYSLCTNPEYAYFQRFSPPEVKQEIKHVLHREHILRSTAPPSSHLPEKSISSAASSPNSRSPGEPEEKVRQRSSQIGLSPLTPESKDSSRVIKTQKSSQGGSISPSYPVSLDSIHHLPPSSRNRKRNKHDEIYFTKEEQVRKSLEPATFSEDEIVENVLRDIHLGSPEVNNFSPLLCSTYPQVEQHMSPPGAEHTAYSPSFSSVSSSKSPIPRGHTTFPSQHHSEDSDRGDQHDWAKKHFLDVDSYSDEEDNRKTYGRMSALQNGLPKSGENLAHTHPTDYASRHGLSLPHDESQLEPDLSHSSQPSPSSLLQFGTSENHRTHSRAPLARGSVISARSPEHVRHGGGPPIRNMGEIIFSGSRNLYRFHADALETNGTTLVGLIMDGTIIRWNSVMQKITGFTAHQVVGKSIFHLLSSEESRQRMKTALQLGMQYTGAWSHYVKEGFSHQSVYSFRQCTGLYAVGIAFSVIPSSQTGTAQVLLLIGRAAQLRSASHYADDVTRWLQNSFAPQIRVCQDSLEVMERKKWNVSQDDVVRLHASIDICAYMVDQFVRFSKLNQESFNQALCSLRLPALMRYFTKEAWCIVKQTKHSFSSNFDGIPQFEVFMEPQKVVEVLKGILLDILKCAQVSKTTISMALLISVIEPEFISNHDVGIYEGPQPSLHESRKTNSSNYSIHLTPNMQEAPGSTNFALRSKSLDPSTEPQCLNGFPGSLSTSPPQVLTPPNAGEENKEYGTSPNLSPGSAICQPFPHGVVSGRSPVSPRMGSSKSAHSPSSQAAEFPQPFPSLEAQLGLTSPLLYHSMMSNLESLCSVRRIRFEMRDSGKPMQPAVTAASLTSPMLSSQAPLVNPNGKCYFPARHSSENSSPTASPPSIGSPSHLNNEPTGAFPASTAGSQEAYQRGTDLGKITPIIADLGGIIYGFFSKELESNVMRLELPLLVAPGGDEDGVEGSKEEEVDSAPVTSGTHTVIVADNNRIQTNTLCQILWARHHAVVPVSSYTELMRQMENGVGNILMIDPVNLTISTQELEKLRGEDPFDTIIDKSFGMVMVVMVSDWGDWRVQKLLNVKNVIRLPKTGASAHIHISIQIAEKQAAEIQEEKERFDIIRRTFTSAVPNRHKVVRLLGKGSFGDVFEVEDTLTGGKMAMKEMRLSVTADPDTVLQELLAMTALQHENIIRYFFCEKISDAVLHLYMEVAVGGTLKDKVRSDAGKNGLPFEETVRYLRETCNGLAYIHSQRYVHRDIKPANLLLDKEQRVKIGDFGTAKRIKSHEELYRLVGTPQYIAPEVFSANVAEMIGYSFKVDVWSLGCVAMELATGQPPFSHLERAQGVGIIKYLTELTTEPDISSLEGHHPLLYDFVKQCLQLDPTMRPTADQLLTMDLFSKELSAPETAVPSVPLQAEGSQIQRMSGTCPAGVTDSLNLQGTGMTISNSLVSHSLMSSHSRRLTQQRRSSGKEQSSSVKVPVTRKRSISPNEIIEPASTNIYVPSAAPVHQDPTDSVSPLPLISVALPSKENSPRRKTKPKEASESNIPVWKFGEDDFFSSDSDD